MKLYQQYFNEKGKNIGVLDLKTKDHKSPLYLSASLENDDIFWYLLNHEVLLDQPDLNGKNEVLVAAENQYFDRMIQIMEMDDGWKKHQSEIIGQVINKGTF